MRQEAEKTAGLPAGPRKGRCTQYNSPLQDGSWEEEKKGREKGGGEVGRPLQVRGRRNRRETGGNRNRARTNVDKTCHIFSKQDRVETHAKAQHEDSV